MDVEGVTRENPGFIQFEWDERFKRWQGEKGSRIVREVAVDRTVYNSNRSYLPIQDKFIYYSVACNKCLIVFVEIISLSSVESLATPGDLPD